MLLPTLSLFLSLIPSLHILTASLPLPAVTCLNLVNDGLFSTEKALAA